MYRSWSIGSDFLPIACQRQLAAAAAPGMAKRLRRTAAATASEFCASIVVWRTSWANSDVRSSYVGGTVMSIESPFLPCAVSKRWPISRGNRELIAFTSVAEIGRAHV